MDGYPFRYQNITILKDQTLGHGSYGAVYKARCDQLTCAAKILHPTIVDSFDPGSEKILQRFRQECEFLNQIRHPHIVQYLGVCRDPDSNLPALLMELLDGSLTKMLESSPHQIAYYIQVDLCHHVALAIAYLHSNGIIHRDLSGNNVLVIAGRTAKVTDFGMSRIVGTEHHLTPLTLCPGTLGYMSPESLLEPPQYTEKLDVFSQGVIMIQVCTRQFPNPGPAMKQVEDSRYPLGMVQVPVSERERRKKDIDLIDPTYPLLTIALGCLEYRERDRPSAEELCQKLADLKVTQEYIESSQNTTPTTPEVNGTLQQEQDELARGVEVTARFQETKQQLLQQIQDLQMQVETLQMQQQVVLEQPKDIVLQWRDQKKAPFSSVRESSVVVGSIAYFCSGSKIYSYNSSLISLRRWNNLPECPQMRGSLAIVYGLLTMVGGEQKDIGFPTEQAGCGYTTNRLVSLTDRGKWVERFPPMPTPSSDTTATNYQNHHLIVAGGTSMDIEVLNTVTLAWSTAANSASLHYPSNGTATIAGDRLYMLGGNDRDGKSVFSCALTELIESCQTPSAKHSEVVWQRDADIPVYRSTCATVDGQLVAFGGEFEDRCGDSYDDKTTTAVYKYDPNTQSWTIISHMKTARSRCYVVVMESINQLMVVGGCVNVHIPLFNDEAGQASVPVDCTTSVEIARY